MEELIRQLEEFFQSFWGGLACFLGVLIMVFATNYYTTREWNLMLAIGDLLTGMSLMLFLFIERHTLLGTLAALAALQALVFLVARVRRRRQEGKALWRIHTDH